MSQASERLFGFRNALERVLQSDAFEEEQLHYILQALEKVPVDADVLQQTGIVQPLRTLKNKYSENAIGIKAKSILSRWKKDCLVGEAKSSSHTSKTNEPLRDDVISDANPAPVLVTLSAKDMATEDLKDLREETTKTDTLGQRADLREIKDDEILAANGIDPKKAFEFVCGKSKGSKTTLTVNKAKEIYVENPSLFHALFSALLSNLDDVDVVDLIESIKGDLSAANTETLSLLVPILSSCGALVRMYIAVLEDHNTTVKLSQESIEKMLLLLQSLISNAFSGSNVSNKTTKISSKQRSVSSSSEVASKLITHTAMIMDAMNMFVKKVKPSGTITSLLLEISYLAFKAESFIKILAVWTEEAVRSSIRFLQNICISVVQTVFNGQREYRGDIITSLVQSMRDSLLSTKTHLKLFIIPISTSTNDSIYISAHTVCILSCLQVNENSVDSTESDLLAHQQRICAHFAVSLIQRALRKEAGSDGFEALTHFISELMIAVQSVEWIAGSLLIEQIVCKLVLQLRSMCSTQNEGGDTKRDLSVINLVIELLSILMEQVCVIKHSFPPLDSPPSGIVENVRSRLEMKWSGGSRRAHWQPVASNTAIADAYWNNGEATELPPTSYLAKCERGFLMCKDVMEVLLKISEDGVAALPVSQERLLEFSFGLLPALLGDGFGILLEDVGCYDLIFWTLCLFGMEERDKRNGTTLYWKEEISMNGRLGDLVNMWRRYLCRKSEDKDPAIGATWKTCIERFRKNNEDEYLGSNLFSPSLRYFAQSIVFGTVLEELGLNIENAFFSSLYDPSSMIRSRLSKALLKSIQADPSLMRQGIFQEGLLLTIRDKAISVREEGVKMVGIYLADPARRFDEEIVRELRFMLFDEGISVRKAVVNMFGSILQSQPDHPAYLDVATGLLERMSYVKEEESVKEFIAQIFQQIWFTPPPACTLQLMQKLLHDQIASSECVGGSQSSDSVESIFPTHVEFTARHVVSIMAIPSTASAVEHLLRGILHGASEGTEAARSVNTKRQTAYAYGEKIVHCLIDLLLSTEEKLAIMVKADQSCQSNAGSDMSLDQLEQYKANVIATIAMFGEVHPPFLSQYSHIFIPYLKCPNGALSSAEASILRNVMKIIESLSVLQKTDIRNHSECILSDLTRIMLTQGGATVSVAISCISTLIVNITGDAGAILQVAEKCFMALVMLAKTLTESSSISPLQSAQVQRCLVVLGGVCAHAKKLKTVLLSLSPHFKGTAKKWIQANEQVAVQRIDLFQRLEPHLLTGSCYAAAAFALSLNDEAVRARAVQTLCDTFLGNPRLMLIAQSTSLLSELLDLSNGSVIHERLLVGLRNLLVKEEAVLEKNVTLHQLEQTGVSLSAHSKKVLGPADTDSDATIGGFVIQHHLPMLTKFLSHSSSVLRLACLQLLGSLLRQGMVCPLDAFGLLIMLQCDRDEHIRSEALQVLLMEDERHPTFMENRLREGVDLSYEFQKSIYEVAQAGSTTSRGEIEPFFGPLYTLSIQPNKRRWQGFLQALLRKCTLLAQSCAVQTKASQQSSKLLCTSVDNALSQTQYLVAVLASLPFSTSEEVHYILHWINRNIPYEMSVLLVEIKAKLNDCGVDVGSEEFNVAPVALLSPPVLVSSENEGPIRSASKKKKAKTVLPSTPQQEELRDILKMKLSTLDSDEVSRRLLGIACTMSELRCKEMLIRLKCFLKMSYGLTDERCVAYDPKAKAQVLQSFATEKVVRVESCCSFSTTGKDSVDLVAFFRSALDGANSETNGNNLFASLLHNAMDEFDRVNLILKKDPDDFQLSSKSRSSPATKKAANTKKSPRVKPHKMSKIDEDEEYVSDASESLSVSSTSSRSSKRMSAKRPISYVLEEDD